MDLLGATGARAGGRPKASETKGPQMKLREGGICLGFPAAWRATIIKTPLWDQGLCSGSHVGSQGTYLCVTADRAAVWLQDRMNVICSRCFPELEGGAPTGFRPCVPTPICAMRVHPQMPQLGGGGGGECKQRARGCPSQLTSASGGTVGSPS